MAWWQYLILANLYLVLFYGFYILLLRRETFFQLNRVYLVASALLSFIIPALQANWVQNLFITQQVNQIIYNQPVVIYQYATVAEDNRLSIGQILVMIYAAGIILLTGRLIWQLFKLKTLVDQPHAPAAFSFFKKINVNSELSNSDIITAHEEVHAKQWHSADVLIMEVVMILNWFNPVVYFYRRAIKHIHEFIADSQVIKTGADKAGYAMLLLTHTLNSPSHSLANQFFNHKLLKKRIIMLQKNRSQRVRLIKYGLSAPLFALMLILSSATVNNSKTVKAINRSAEQVFEAKADTTFTLKLDQPIKNNEIVTRKVITDTIPAGKEVFNAVEEVPEFPGGMPAFIKFLQENIRYPNVMREKKIEGRVFVTFVVEKDGSLSDFKVLRDIGYGSGKEAKRVLSLSPKWKPGYQNGKPVRVQYNVPIAFDLGEKMGTSTGVSEPNGIGMANAVSIQQFGIDEMPQFPGGMAAFSKYLGTNTRYPAIDRNNKVSGRVFLTFVVQEDGLLTNINALRSPSLSLQNEAIRVLARSPKWIPGKKDGKPVKVAMNVPVNFNINDETSQAADTKPAVANSISLGLDEVNIVAFSAKADGQLILLNGEEISKKTMDALDPKSIEGVNVLTGNDATSKYGERGKDGVIMITSKANKAPGQAASDFFIEGTSRLNADPALRPLILVDGKEKTYEQLKAMDVKNIEAISVLKDAASIKKYGDKGKNGVLMVTTKKNK
ncbi:MAG: TonB family protein [Mucilaginibacter sp.]